MATPRPSAAAGQRPHDGGFTLLECVVVTAVVAVLATLSVTAMYAGVQRQSLVAAAETLASDLAQARQLAAKRGQAVQVHARATADHPGVHLLQSRTATLWPNGTAAAGPVAVFESAQGQRLRVDMLVLGRSRICTLPSAGAAATDAGQPGLGALSRYARCA